MPKLTPSDLWKARDFRANNPLPHVPNPARRDALRAALEAAPTDEARSIIEEAFRRAFGGGPYYDLDVMLLDEQGFP